MPDYQQMKEQQDILMRMLTSMERMELKIVNLRDNKLESGEAGMVSAANMELILIGQTRKSVVDLLDTLREILKDEDFSDSGDEGV